MLLLRSLAKHKIVTLCSEGASVTMVPRRGTILLILRVSMVSQRETIKGSALACMLVRSTRWFLVLRTRNHGNPKYRPA